MLCNFSSIIHPNLTLSWLVSVCLKNAFSITVHVTGPVKSVRIMGKFSRIMGKISNYAVKASIPTIILFSVIRKDVDDLYKWKTFRPTGLHQSQISMKAMHALGRNVFHLHKSSTSSRITQKKIIVGMLVSTT